MDTVFPFADARYLHPGETNGGLVHRTHETATGALPLVVFLHGTNEGGPLHRGLGAKGFDLRSIDADLPPLLLAGPSMTRDAKSGSRLWPEFDLAAFVDAVEGALPSDVRVDRARVVLVGHSGAGCNLRGGLLSRSNLTPCAVVAIDTCLDEAFGRAFAELTNVHVFYQPSWPRDPAAFEAAFGRSIVRLDVPGPNPHDDIVPLVLSRVLPTLLSG